MDQTETAAHVEMHKQISKIIFDRVPRIKGVHCASIAYGIIDFISQREKQKQAAPGVPEVYLPERVIDTLWQSAGLSTYHPDGDQLEKLYVFALLVKSEVLARLPAPASPSLATERDAVDAQKVRDQALEDCMVSELIAIAQYLRGVQHWEAQAGATRLAEIAKKLIDSGAIQSQSLPSTEKDAGLVEIPLNVIRNWPEAMPARLEHVWKDLIGFIPNYKLYDLQRCLAEFGLTMKVYESAAIAQKESGSV